MHLELVTAPVGLPAQVDELRDHLKISHMDEDGVLTTYLQAATAACECYLGRKLLAQQWRLTLNDWGDGIVTLPLSPILSVDEAKVWRAGAFETLDPAMLLLDHASYEARLMSREGSVFPDPDRQMAGIEISFSAGFGADPNALPPDLRQGILLWVGALYDPESPAMAQGAALAERLWQPYRRMVL
ncbi:head-tail connector protein [Paremcibacter congregatus]|uniref:head-tail connector protein n=1 Tax=Paremcibacter congregatus TaxID=2043170 RepID=UPI0030ED4120|tara:strand:- start:1555 stop:2112 length:558 start_codon:yes stop_codon:yes gene_type:complete